MPTECNPTLFEFAPVEDRKVVAGFDGGTMSSNAGGRAGFRSRADGGLRLRIKS